jgi:hypothetical protein
MRNFFNNKRNLIILSIIIVVVIGILFGIKKLGAKKENKENLLVNEEVIPTVSNNVKVSLEQTTNKGRVTLSVENAPTGTKEIEYQLTYSRVDKESGNDTVQEGVIGKCAQKLNYDNIWSCQKSDENSITLGTCSSGTCVYHEIVGDITVYLTFTGSYGQKAFEKNFTLE